jgi:ribonucleoside-diphosphate reductase alpha chain
MQSTKPNIGREDVVIPEWLKYQPGMCKDHFPGGKTWPGVTVKRHYTSAHTDPYSAIQWETTDVTLPGDEAKVVKCRFPAFFSERARKIVAAKYLKVCDNGNGVQDFEVLVRRIVQRITGWGDDYGYYASSADRDAHYDELSFMLLNQHFAFNSPVWFNFGIDGIAQQGSACFIVPVEDTLDDLSNWYTVETRIFKRGSGSGADVSRIRSSRESLSLGGRASGPLSFMKVADCNAGQIKSGGTTRRAAKMVVMRCDHPDILENNDGTPGFIRAKSAAEKVAHTLIDAGYPVMFNAPGNAYSLVDFQNANHSVRITEEFMEAYERGVTYWTKYVKTGHQCAEYSARQVLREIAEATWFCGDPGVQFDDHINSGNTCPNSFWIWASNPCSEYISRDNTSCNLASIRLTKYLTGEPGNYGFDTTGYLHTVDIAILAMEIIVAGGDFPTGDIAYWTKVFRNLGLGHCDLGAMLMKLGLAYDSDQGRGIAAMLCSTLTARAYAGSATIAGACGGPFAEWDRNWYAMLGVLGRHARAHTGAQAMNAGVSLDHPIARQLHADGDVLWDAALDLGRQFGFRNANVTLEAPTGTISFIMDCDTTGIEPCISLVAYKNLVGGGVEKMANQAVADALKALGYSEGEQVAILGWVADTGAMDNCVYLKPQHLPVFDCAFAPSDAFRTISWQGHMKMLGAIQPFLSMSISKTVNMPNTATVEDIEQAYYQAWKLGVKCVAIYRDGCKRSQPLEVKKQDAETLVGITDDGETQELRDRIKELEARLSGIGAPVRRKLPRERHAITHKFDIGGVEGYVTVGLYEDGTPGELFITMSKEGSTVAGFADGFATAVSLGLQYGVPLSKMIDKYSHMRFEPSGWTGNQDIPQAKSILDYIFRWLNLRFGTPEQSSGRTAPVITINLPEGMDREAALHRAASIVTDMMEREMARPSAFACLTGPQCPECHSITQPAGKCYICPDCGTSTGCS